jgi:hypothetical protein
MCDFLVNSASYVSYGKKVANIVLQTFYVSGIVAK